MNAREELLQNLYGAKEIINQAEEITRRYQATKSKLQAKRQFIPVRDSVTDIGIYILAGMGLAILAGITAYIVLMLPILSVKLFWLGLFLVAALAFGIKLRRDQKFYKAANENRMAAVAKQNEEIARYNVQVQKEADEINREMTGIREIARQRLGGWYPPDYMYSEAVNFFIGAFQNYKVNDMREAVNLYDKKLYEDEQLEIQRGLNELQRQQNRLQKMQNILSAANLFANLGTAYNAGRAANDINDIKYRMTGYR